MTWNILKHPEPNHGILGLYITTVSVWVRSGMPINDAVFERRICGKKYPHDKDNVQCCKHHRQKLTNFSESVIHTSVLQATGS
jgi:hypothetical protein